MSVVRVYGRACIRSVGGGLSFRYNRRRRWEKKKTNIAKIGTRTSAEEKVVTPLKNLPSLALLWGETRAAAT
ncbi:hypothetical protein TEQG_08713 [Trichophyton equinum CBS 127.97]|uniref:Uncharacterized protein n=1 Tax=Trichophyton equinum (strain ATCC MYA-4606 / CBS 127.97) TaxID=559882 RepID=F2PVJ6_TRIEC|nr:hypothetical protein TEQG_08713 [Trichophyton equinum CBS 127.97]